MTIPDIRFETNAVHSWYQVVVFLWGTHKTPCFASGIEMWSVFLSSDSHPYFIFITDVVYIISCYTVLQNTESYVHNVLRWFSICIANTWLFLICVPFFCCWHQINTNDMKHFIPFSAITDHYLIVPALYPMIIAKCPYALGERHTMTPKI